MADGFEEMEAIAPVDLLRRAGVHCDLVSVQQGRSVTGTQGITLVADGTLEGLSGDYELLLLPGGMPGV
ncbi:MAG: DJ-1/PfpI family protein, partial [Oscillospiraceae bacterium]